MFLGQEFGSVYICRKLSNTINKISVLYFFLKFLYRLSLTTGLSSFRNTSSITTLNPSFHPQSVPLSSYKICSVISIMLSFLEPHQSSATFNMYTEHIMFTGVTPSTHRPIPIYSDVFNPSGISWNLL